MILIVDDDPSVTASLALLLKQAGYASHAAASPAEALAWLEAHPCELVLQDMNFSRRTTGRGGAGPAGADQARCGPALPVILITAWGSIQLAVEGMKAGATDFITKPWTHEQILQTVRTVLGLAASTGGRRSASASREELDATLRLRRPHRRGPAAAAHPADDRPRQRDRRLGAHHRRKRHRQGTGGRRHSPQQPAAPAPFVKVNLGGISASLFESEMFGHVRGAFTDARHDRKGRFEMADGGTIFLDEIGDLDPASQVKLLRVLQDRTYEVLGSSQRRTVDVRVVAATNRNLGDMVARGEFREDLLYRINLITLHLPPLRERRDDIPMLATPLPAGCRAGVSSRGRAHQRRRRWPG